MNKNVVVCLSIIAVTAIICFFIYTQNNRFVTVNAGDGKVYKINKRTGESIWIRGAQEIPVAPSEPTKEGTIEEGAISWAKAAYTLGGVGVYSQNNNSQIRSAVEKMTGDLKIIGWQARQADEQTFVVTYSYDNGNGVRCWAFEVKPKEGFVRNIIGDASLEKKYGFVVSQPPPQGIRPEIQRILDALDKEAGIAPVQAPVPEPKATGYIKDQQGNIIVQTEGQPAP